MDIINLTQHAVVLMRDGAEIVETISPSGAVARAAQTDAVVGSIEVCGKAVELVRTSFGNVSGLPATQDGVRFIVSLQAARAAEAHGRTTEDLLLTSDAVRDAAGKIVGCRRFALYP